MTLHELKQKYSRVTIRAVIKLDAVKYLMCYNAKYSSYTFPGGGVEDNENDAKAVLIRELKEETGLDLTNCNLQLQQLCSLVETANNQLSIFYIVTDWKQNAIYGKPELETDEKKEGLTSVAITLIDAYMHNKHKSIITSVTNRECMAINKLLQQAISIAKEG